MAVDANAEVINVYVVVQHAPRALIAALEEHQRAFQRALLVSQAEYDAYYYALRAQDPSCMGEVARAARTVALNRTCMNGLYRRNRDGVFNAPVGRQQPRKDGIARVPRIAFPDRIRACSKALQHVILRVGDMMDELSIAPAGHLVYVDPPYIPLNLTSNFTAYTGKGFGMADQERLAHEVERAASRGVLVAVSNSDTKAARRLYRRFNITRVTASRSIGRKVATRGEVSEIFVRTWV